MWKSFTKLLKLVGYSKLFREIFEVVGIHKVRAKNLKKLKALGAQVRKLRIDGGFTQEQLADEAGVSENTIVTLESGKLNTTVATCFEIAKALGVPPKELFDF